MLFHAPTCRVRKAGGFTGYLPPDVDVDHSAVELVPDRHQPAR